MEGCRGILGQAAISIASAGPAFVPVESSKDGRLKTQELTIQTGRHRGLHDLTGACERFVAGEGDGGLRAWKP